MIRPDGFWIGHPGALLPLPGIKGELSRTVERAAEFAVSASGRRRAYLSARRAPLREWKVTVPHLRPDEAAFLQDLLMATDPPYVWVDPWSRVTNLLTPSAAGLQETVPALSPLGRQPLADGTWSATAGSKPGGGVVDISPAPVVPDQPVTVSAYLGTSGIAYVTAVFLDSNGAELSSVNSDTVTGVDVLNRAFVAGLVTPANAAAVGIRVVGASVIAHPAVTWTAELVEYGAGGGAAQVLVTGWEESISRAAWLPGSSFRSDSRLSELSFTVTEVD